MKSKCFFLGWILRWCSFSILLRVERAIGRCGLELKFGINIFMMCGLWL